MPVRSVGRISIGAALSLLPLMAPMNIARAQTPVLTQAGGNARTGLYSNEIVLSPANVAVSTFGLLFTRTLDANVNGQVLYVPSVTIGGTTHNVMVAYTSNNSNGSSCSLYAFDADEPSAGTALWRHQFTNAAEWTTCAPVIDPSTGTIYVVTKDTNDAGATWLHAIDLISGSEKPGSPIEVAATVAGTGDGNNGGQVSFNSAQANCRTALLFANNSVYFGFAHNTDSYPYHGWIFRYTYNGTSFTQANVFCTDPNGGEGGVWMAGDGLAADLEGNVYATTGNGTFDVDSGGTSYGMSVLKLSPTLAVEDWFTPWDEASNSNSDYDFGNCGVLLIPGTDRLFSGGTKFASAFLLDSTNLGHFTSGGPDNVLNRINSLCSTSNVGQNPVAWDSGTYKYTYIWPKNEGIEQFRYDPSAGKLNPNSIYLTGSLTNGGSLAVSSNGTSNGILWAVGGNGIVHAIGAGNVTQADLWNSGMDSSRDGIGSVGHWQFATVANGRVYVPTGNASIAVYGLLSTTATPVIAPASTTFTGSQSVTITDTTPNSSIYYTTDGTVPYPGQGTTQLYSTSFDVDSSSVVNAIAFSPNSEPSAVVSQTYTSEAATPSIAPTAGTYKTSVQISITDSTAESSIYYTLDGSSPSPGTGTTQLYSDPFTLTRNATVNAVATAANVAPSTVASSTYKVQAEPPIFTPGGGYYTAPVSVTMTDETPGVSFYYTTDGSSPNPGAAGTSHYHEPVVIQPGTFLQAIATLSGGQRSDVRGAHYDIPTAAAPTMSPNGGHHMSSSTITLTDTTKGASIYYTTDGATPSPGVGATRMYSTPFTITASATIDAVATAPGYRPSGVDSAAFTIQTSKPGLTPNGGTITGPTSVTITCATPGATIYYTTNGTTPVVPGGTTASVATTGGTLTYTGPFTVDPGTNVQAIGTAPGQTASEIANVTFN